MAGGRQDKLWEWPLRAPDHGQMRIFRVAAVDQIA